MRWPKLPRYPPEARLIRVLNEGYRPQRRKEPSQHESQFQVCVSGVACRIFARGRKRHAASKRCSPGRAVFAIDAVQRSD